MGLCKCPKRQVTNQFCFEHRVNVCEHCMVTSHPKCVVQSYLQWLKDSDYDSSCSLCRTALEAGDCVRLICYHVFHWDCLNAREAALPANTAPSGRTCPVCSDHVFPPGNLISPVADVLRSRLGQVNWGRSELGLPLLAGEQQPIARQHQQQLANNSNNNGSSSSGNYHQQQQKQTSALHSAFAADGGGQASASAVAHSVLNMDQGGSGQFDGPMSSRRPLLAARASPIGASDADDNKYKKRSPAEMFRRWSRRFYAPSSRPPWRRTWCLALCGVLAFVFFVYMMAVLGRGTSAAELGDGDADDVQSHM